MEHPVLQEYPKMNFPVTKKLAILWYEVKGRTFQKTILGIFHIIKKGDTIPERTIPFEGGILIP